MMKRPTVAICYDFDGTLWKVDGEFKRLGYIDARKHIYLPAYAKAVVKTEAYRRLSAMRDEGKNLLLVDFDGYNRHLPRCNFTYNDVLVRRVQMDPEPDGDGRRRRDAALCQGRQSHLGAPIQCQWAISDMRNS